MEKNKKPTATTPTVLLFNCYFVVILINLTGVCTQYNKTIAYQFDIKLLNHKQFKFHRKNDEICLMKNKKIKK